MNIIRTYNERKASEVWRRYNEGGTLYFIERVEDSHFPYEQSYPDTNLSNSKNFNKTFLLWSPNIHFLTVMTGAFLTKEEAEKRLQEGIVSNPHFDLDTKKEKCIVSEHNFLKDEKI